MENPIFDLHLHPAFKNFLKKHYDEFPNGEFGVHDKNGTAPIKMENNLIRFLDDNFFTLLKSQSSFQQLLEGNVKQAAVGISNVEYGFAASKGLFGKLLKDKSTKILDTTYFELIRDGKISYLKMFIKELDFYVRIHNSSENKISYLTRKVKEIAGEKDLNGIEEKNKNKSNLEMVFAIEGGHNLSARKVGQLRKKDSFTDCGFLGDLENEISFRPEKNLSLLYKEMWKRGMDILYLTLTHLTHIEEQYLANHAFGMKLLKHSSFYPHGFGISDQGYDVINAALSNEVEGKALPIYIDVKHMSLISRLEYYNYRKEHFPSMPIIASHMGVAGYSIEEWKDNLKIDKLRLHNFETVRSVEVRTERKMVGKWGAINKKFTFNPWTINLLDEDIIEIVDSKGLIGLSMDVRVLGFQALIGMTMSDTSEYLSQMEFQHFFPHINLSNLELKDHTEAEADLESWISPTKDERHPLCFCFNIVHIMTIGQSKSGLPWEEVQKVICIGSDFDGLISPMKICRTSSSYTNLAHHLVRWLPVAIKAYQNQNGFSDDYYEYAKDKKSTIKFIKGVMSGNANEFIERWKNP